MYHSFFNTHWLPSFGLVRSYWTTYALDYPSRAIICHAPADAKGNDHLYPNCYKFQP
jgi:hypothetical protein